MVLEGGPAHVWAVAFHPDGKHLFDGTRHGIRRWRVADGQEVGKQTGMDLNVIAVSSDHKWVVCGTTEGASVWDAEIREKVVEVEGGERVYAVDVTPDCAGFATGTSGKANIWNITTGERLLGPLEHDGDVGGVKFSSDGGRIATACSRDSSIRIFDSDSGDLFISIENQMPASFLPIAWSADSQRLFTISTDYGPRIKSFGSSTGSQLAQWQIHESNDLMSIALSANGKFIAASAGCFVSFWDTSTYTQLGIVEDSN